MQESSLTGARAKRWMLQGLGVVLAVVGASALAAPVAHHVGEAKAVLVEAVERSPHLMAPAQTERLVWRGADIDGDGAADFVNPTGHDTRKTDAYGCGDFGASRDGGVRKHEGVDFIADAGQRVVAPISGYVTKIGFAYPGDSQLKFVEVTNPALHYAARVFYVDPSVEVGQAVRLGQAIGVHHTLEQKYPGGMTDHVHLEIIDNRGERINAAGVLSARYEAAPSRPAA